jgi:hypothetical protein
MTIFQQLKAKQKADKGKREARLAKRRQYARVARERKQESGLDDLPIEVAVVIEQNATPPTTPAAPLSSDDSVENLVSRLEAIRERIWRLRAMFAVSLSHDCALEADRYLQLFQDLARQLKTKDANALEDLVRGHESLLLSPPVPVRQIIHIDTQRWCEIRWETSRSPKREVPERSTEQIPDGLGWML